MINNFYSTLTGTTNPGQSGLGSYCNGRSSHFLTLQEPHYHMHFSIVIGTLVGAVRDSYFSAKMQSVYSTAPADKAENYLIV